MSHGPPGTKLEALRAMNVALGSEQADARRGYTKVAQQIRRVGGVVAGLHPRPGREDERYDQIFTVSSPHIGRWLRCLLDQGTL